MMTNKMKMMADAMKMRAGTMKSDKSPKNMHQKHFNILIFALCLFVVPSANGQSKEEYVPCQEMPSIMLQFETDHQAIKRFYTPATGNTFRNEGLELAINSPEMRSRMTVLYNDYLQRLGKISFTNLPQECKVDYILFKRDVTKALNDVAQEEIEYNKIKNWIPFADRIYALEKSRRRGIQLNAELVSKEWAFIISEILLLQGKIKEEKNLSSENIYTLSEAVEGLRKASASIYEFYNGYDPKFTWWVSSSYKGLDTTLRNYGKAVKSLSSKFVAQDKSGIVGQPAGRPALVRQLAYEMIPYSPEELIEIANREFAWCDKELLKASAEMGFGNDWKAAQEKVKNSFVEPGKQPEAILKLYNESIDFLKKNNLITIPPIAEETWGMMMMSPERQLVNPFFLGGNDIIISYPTNTMKEDDRMMSMRGNNPHFSRATVHHELIAGHNLQFFMNRRHRTYRNFDTPFWMEGWALYWELLLWDMEFPQGPEDRIGMLFWHMHRCARIIFSLNYHMGKWTPQQCIDFLVERVGHERANAEGEVRRSFTGRYPPLYQLAYLTGGRQFNALKKELVDSKKMTYREYHDAVMKLNSMPVEMIRAILTDQKLTEDYKTNWKFYTSKDVEGKQY
jgi:hypothetical protein